MTIRLTALILYLFSLALCGAALADDKAEAKARFKAAVALFSDENYPGALQAFEDSYRIVPKASLLYNIGMCKKALYRFVDALATFRRYLDEAGDSVTSEKRRAVETSIAEMERLVGTLVVADAPESAAVSLDGVRIGETPLAAPVVLDPGQHSVRVAKDGFLPMETQVTIASGAALTLRAALQPTKGVLSVSCGMGSAEVTVDGRPVGGCPFEGEVAAGGHDVEVAAPGMKVFTRSVTVVQGERIALTVLLEPEATAPEPKVEIAKTAPVSPAPLPEESDRGKRRTALVAAGAVGLALGAGLLGAGAYFNHRAADDERQGNDAYDAMDDLQYANKDEYDVLYQKLSNANDDLRVHNAVMIAGYAAGGALLATGVGLLVAGLSKGGGETSTVSATAGGMAVRF